MRHLKRGLHFGLIGGLAMIAAPASAQLSGGVSAVPLTPAELRTTQMSSNWRSGVDTVTAGEDGKIMFLYGKSQPTIVCAPLRLCDLELDVGEEVLNVHTGDTVRWKFDGARSGPKGNTPHILIKPTEANIETSLVITTDRRSYHIHLKSSPTKYMARMGFDYAYDPQSVVYSLQQSAPEPVMAPQTVEVVKYVPTMPGFKSAEDLDFDYDIDGKAKWKPLRVYNDGTKTYIEMSKKMSQSEAPALMVIGKDRKEQLVNYRLVDDRYIVDQIFDKAIMIAGVGRKQEKITIKYEG